MSDDRAAPSAPDALGTVLLPTVVHEASAAVLIVDLDRRAVTYANDLARQLAPDATLPMAIDEWSAAAGLEDVAGDSEAGGPPPARPAESLLRIAQGRPVTGEAVTARRATGVTGAREVLWVLGLPLSGAPEPIASLALVAFLPARNARLIAGVQESAAMMRDRAVLATRVSFTITDPRSPDDPLVWVNPAFTETTGYSFDEAVGSNCRFLQGPDTDRAVVAEIRDALVDERPVTATLINYRRDGTPFWNELSISPMRDEAGTLTHFVGVQADVTARVEAQRTRDEALAQVAQVAGRLGLLADITSRMAAVRRPAEVVEMLTSVLTPRVATMCAVYPLDEQGRLGEVVLRHERQRTDPKIRELMDRLRAISPRSLGSAHPVWQVLRGEQRQLLLTDYSRSQAAAGATFDERVDLVESLGVASVIVVPLPGRRELMGAVVVANDRDRRPLGESEVALVQDLAARTGLMLENTRLNDRQRAVAATLQRSLLPRLPRIEGMEVAASYVPAADEAAVGGDWYDVFELRRADGAAGGVGVVVGDVMGHNYDSAARMGKLSTIVRSYAWPGSDPFTVLTAVDELLEGTRADFLATCVYARLRRHARGATVQWSSAGHPPAVLRRPGGTTVTLDAGRGPMIGISGLMPDGARRPGDAALDLPRGSTLIAFTDGLTDALAEEPDLDEGLGELGRIVSALPPDAAPQTIVDALTAAARRHDDDVAVVAIRIG